MERIFKSINWEYRALMWKENKFSKYTKIDRSVLQG